MAERKKGARGRASEAARSAEESEVGGSAVAAEAGAPAVLDVNEPAADVTAQAADRPDTGAPQEPVVSAELKAIIEALIFASPEPLTMRALVKVLAGEPKEDVERAVEALKLDYQQLRGLQLIEIAGGLQIVTRTDLNEWVRRLFHERKTTKLSVQALETLAVIAYRQPVTSPEIAEIRGVNTSGVLATLIERKLVKIAGRKPVVGRPFLYATTREFLMRFGLNDLGDLPKVEDMADLLGFDLASALSEPMPADQMLPLDVSDEPAGTDAQASDAAAEPPAPTAPDAEADGVRAESPIGEDDPVDDPADRVVH